MEDIPLWITNCRWSADYHGGSYRGDGYGDGTYVSPSTVSGGVGMGYGHWDGDGESEADQQFIPLGELTGV